MMHTMEGDVDGVVEGFEIVGSLLGCTVGDVEGQLLGSTLGDVEG